MPIDEENDDLDRKLIERIENAAGAFQNTTAYCDDLSEVFGGAFSPKDIDRRLHALRGLSSG